MDACGESTPAELRVVSCLHFEVVAYGSKLHFQPLNCFVQFRFLLQILNGHLRRCNCSTQQQNLITRRPLKCKETKNCLMPINSKFTTTRQANAFDSLVTAHAHGHQCFIKTLRLPSGER